MTQPAPVVSLLEVDDTLLDNDRIVADLQHLARAFATEGEEGYCSHLFKPEAPEPPRKVR